MFFRDVPGHEALKNRLISQVQNQKIPHARLFLGPEGSGSLALALAQIQYIHCLDRQPQDSCGKCAGCQKNLKFIHPDLHFSFPFTGSGKDDYCDLHLAEWRKTLANSPFMGLEEWQNVLHTENKQLNINIRECHEIVKKLSMKPFEAQFQILLLWRPEFLGKEGNSLLKIIEEPSARTLMLFVAENQEEILPTLLSRMQLQKVTAYTDTEIAAWLETRESVDQDSASHFAFMCEGNLGKAIALSRGDVTDYRRLFTSWMAACTSGDYLAIHTWVEGISRSGKDAPGREFRKNFIGFALKMMRESLLENEHAGTLARLGTNDDKLAWSHRLNLVTAEKITGLLEAGSYHIERNANPRILFLDVSLNLNKILTSGTA